MSYRKVYSSYGHGGGRGIRSNRGGDNPDVRLSKELSNVLRHKAKKVGLNLQTDGYARLDELMRLPNFERVTLDKIQLVVREDNKQRFTILEKKSENGEIIRWIRANQGHSIVEVKDLELEKITDYSQVPQVIHGTYLDKWESIESRGLSKMKRNHIHFASGRYGDEGVKSGMRANCNLFIYVNVSKAMSDGIEFHRSANGVILTEGIKGILDKKYFLKVLDAKGNNILYTKENLERITASSQISLIVHETNLKEWETIKLRGLSKMNRDYIKFVTERRIFPIRQPSKPDLSQNFSSRLHAHANPDDDVTKTKYPGVDKNGNRIFIYVDASKAMDDDIEFYRSADGTIVTKGVKGILDKKYFLRVVDENENTLDYTDGNNEKNVKENDNIRSVNDKNVDETNKKNANRNNKKNTNGENNEKDVNGNNKKNANGNNKKRKNNNRNKNKNTSKDVVSHNNVGINKNMDISS